MSSIEEKTDLIRIGTQGWSKGMQCEGMHVFILDSQNGEALMMDSVQFTIFMLPAVFVLFGVYFFSWLICGEEPKGRVWNGFLVLALIWMGLAVKISMSD